MTARVQTLYLQKPPPTDRWSRLRNRIAALIAVPGERFALVQINRTYSGDHHTEVYVRFEMVNYECEVPIVLTAGQSIINEVT